MSKQACIYPGRFQPFHKGHLKVVKNMIADNQDCFPIIALVKGAKTSDDLIKNPFSKDKQIEFIKKSINQIGLTEDNIIVVPDAYILSLTNAVTDKGFEPAKIYGGPDRIPEYKRQLDSETDGVKLRESANLQNLQYVEIERNDDNISASKVREAIESNDYQSFKNMTEGYDESDFKNMKNLIEQARISSLKNEKEKVLDKLKKAKGESTIQKLTSRLKEIANQL